MLIPNDLQQLGGAVRRTVPVFSVQQSHITLLQRTCPSLPLVLEHADQGPILLLLGHEPVSGTRYLFERQYSSTCNLLISD